MRMLRLLKLWRSIPLSRQVFLAMFASIWAVLSLYFVFDIRAVERRLSAAERSSLESVFPVMQDLIEESMLRGERPHVRELFTNAGRGPDAQHLFLLDAKKQAVDLDDLAAGRPARRHQAPQFDAATHLVLDFPLHARASCVRCHGVGTGVLGYVRVSAEHEQRARSVTAHFQTHLLLLALTTAVLGVLAFGIVRRLVQAPLERTVAAMDRLSQGRFDTRIEDLPAGELRAIGTGFNAMARKIEEDRRQILELHRREVAHMERLVALGELAAHLAHEVRNPLTGIGSAIQVMREETPEGSSRREVLDKILGQLSRMDQTMANFLGFARMPEAVVRPFDLGESLQRVTLLLGPRLRSQGITLRQHMPEALPRLSGDPGQIEQVLLNVCLNAVQAMPKGGTLSIDAEAEAEGALRLEVADTGPGIPSDQLDQVFKPFFTTRPNGSGLGLSISRQIVMAHDGEIWIESVPGRGASVFIRLPSGNGHAS